MPDYQLDERAIDCPYCGESITVLIDPSVDQQAYIEDCAVCCRPIEVSVSMQGDGEFELTVGRDDD